MFIEYLKLGIEHILDPKGIDHVLFLIVLVILYSLRDWKNVFILATAFTLGHSLTLALSALDIISVSSKFIEILIAASIAVTALHNLIRPTLDENSKTRYFTATAFGLIHGFGFAGFFRTILGKDAIALPLLSFNIGVEIAQLIVVIIVLALSFLICELLKLKKRYLVIGTSILIFLYALKLILERLG